MPASLRNSLVRSSGVRPLPASCRPNSSSTTLSNFGPRATAQRLELRGGGRQPLAQRPPFREVIAHFVRSLGVRRFRHEEHDQVRRSLLQKCKGVLGAAVLRPARTFTAFCASPFEIAAPRPPRSIGSQASGWSAALSRGFSRPSTAALTGPEQPGPQSGGDDFIARANNPREHLVVGMAPRQLRMNRPDQTARLPSLENRRGLLFPAQLAQLPAHVLRSDAFRQAALHGQRKPFLGARLELEIHARGVANRPQQPHRLIGEAVDR